MTVPMMSGPTPKRGQTPKRRTQANGDLTADRLAVLRTMLEQQRAFRVEQLIDLHQPHLPNTGAALKRPMSDTDLEVFASLAAAARAALNDVQSALWRMDEGTYGRCTECHQPLDLSRLEILPQAALCMACQRRRDVEAREA